MREAIVVATIEHHDGRIEFKTYVAADITIDRLKRKIRRFWADRAAHVACGNGIYRNYYGGH